MKPIDPDVKIVPRQPWSDDPQFRILYRKTKAWIPQRDENGKQMLWSTRGEALGWLIENNIIDPQKIGAGGALYQNQGASS